MSTNLDPSPPHAWQETLALNLTCAECGRSPQRAEVWRVYFADLGEALTYCPTCSEREFGRDAMDERTGA